MRRKQSVSLRIKWLGRFIIALATEGSTDTRFLSSIVKRTIENVCFESQQNIEIFDPVTFPQRGDNIQKKALNSINIALKSGASILFFHTDADASTDNRAFSERINPAFTAIKHSNPDFPN